MNFDQARKELFEKKIVAIMRGVPQDKVGKVAKAVYEGGVRFFEICFNQQSDDPLTEFEKQYQAVRENVGEDAHVGAGTVITKEQVDFLGKLGGEMFVAPNTDVELIKAAKAYGMIAVPGAETPSEIVTAYQAGADLVKLYVVEEPKRVKMLRGPLGHIPMQITCNVSLDTIPQFLEAGIKCFGTKAMTPEAMINKEDYAGIKELSEKFSTAVLQ